MNDPDRTQEDLVSEVLLLRQRLAELEHGDAAYKKRYEDLYEESRNTEEICGSLLSSSADAIVIYDLDGRVQYLSPSFTRIFGWDIQDVRGELIPYVPDCERDATMAVIAGLLNEGRPCSEFETKRLTKDGRILDVSLSASRYHNHQGEPAGMLVILREITDRKKAEFALLTARDELEARVQERTAELSRINDKLRQEIERRERAQEDLRSEKLRFEILTEHAPFGMALVNENATFQYLNPMFREMFGYDIADVPDGSTWLKKAFPDRSYRHEVVATWLRTLEQLGTQNPSSTVFTVRCKDGTDKVVHFSVVQLETGIHLVHCRDITQQHLAEEALRRSEERYRKLYEESVRGQEIYRSLLNSCADAIVTYDLDGHATYVSDSFTNIFGWQPEEVLGQRIPFLPESERAATMDCVFDVINHGIACSGFESKRFTQDGVILDISLSASRFHDHEGNPAGMLVILSDITRRKAAEEELRSLNEELEKRVTERTSQLEAANKELEAFAYSVSHDLRAPLRSIDGFSQMLCEDYGARLDEQAKDYLNRVRAASQRMAQLIDDLLKLSRVTRSEMRREEINLSELGLSVLEDLQRADPERNVEASVTPNMTVNADGRLMRVVLDNLLGNAWKFTSKREHAAIAFGQLEQRSPDAGRLPQTRVYYVQDNGAGFDMNYADKLFGAFQRLHGTTEFPGTGIGLATVQRIVHRHGGSVWAEGAVDVGARFFFTLGS